MATTLAEYEGQVRTRAAPHQELFTRLLESLDGLNLDGLDEETRQFVRTQRKELVKKTQELAGAAARLG